MKPKLLAVIVANLFVAVPFAQAADMDYSGSSVTLGGQVVSKKARDPSKLEEYRDLDTGVLGGFEIRGRGDNYYLNAYGENLGRDDQYINFSGGKYGQFKYRLYDNDLRHNFGSGPGARSPFYGVGGTVLTGPLPNINPVTWGYFDHSYDRRDFGGNFEWQTKSPWYFRMDANEVTRKGINVFAGSAGISPGQGAFDLPVPIDYTTRDGTVEAGYTVKRGHVAVTAGYSKFENANQLLLWQNPQTSVGGPGTDASYLPPDNKMWRLGVNGNLHGLPLDSTLAGRFTYSKLTNDVGVSPQTVGGLFGGATGATSPVFNGKIEKTTLSLSYTSHLSKSVDTKVYYNWIDDKNKSSLVGYSPPAAPLANCLITGTTVCTPEYFEYTKNNAGIEAFYKFNRQNRLLGGYDYTHIDRVRYDFEKTKDNKLFIEWKNTSLESLTGRIKYQYLQTRSDWNVSPILLADPAYSLEPYVRKYDLANKDQNMVKLSLDATPAPMVDVGFEYIYKANDYKDTLLGRTSDTRNEYYASVGVGDAKKARVLLFGDIEFTEIGSYHRVFSSAPPATPPSTPPVAGRYNWVSQTKDKSWQVGLGFDFVPMDRVVVKSSLLYAETSGSADPEAQLGTPGTYLLPIYNRDNTSRTALNVKTIYDYSKNWEFTAGVAYEKYNYSDIGYDFQQYVIPSGAGNVNTTYYTGQYAYQPYSANIFYGSMKYKF